MSLLLKALPFIKALLPTRKIAAWILGVLAALVALAMGVDQSGVREEYCKSVDVKLPTLSAPVVPETK